MKAISIRQPWAWMIIHGGKDIENRDWPTRFRGRVLIHASKAMTRDEWRESWAFSLEASDSPNKKAHDLGLSFLTIERGGIIGSVEIVDCVTDHESDWFMGDYGFILRNPVPMPFVPYRGALGFFDVPEISLDMAMKGGAK